MAANAGPTDPFLLVARHSDNCLKIGAQTIQTPHTFDSVWGLDDSASPIRASEDSATSPIDMASELSDQKTDFDWFFFSKTGQQHR